MSTSYLSGLGLGARFLPPYCYVCGDCFITDLEELKYFPWLIVSPEAWSSKILDLPYKPFPIYEDPTSKWSLLRKKSLPFMPHSEVTDPHGWLPSSALQQFNKLPRGICVNPMLISFLGGLPCPLFPTATAAQPKKSTSKSCQAEGEVSFKHPKLELRMHFPREAE